MTDATTDTTAPVPTRWCRGSSAPCRCPACSRHGQPEAQDGRFARLGREIGELVEAKQRAYGDSYGRSGEVMRVLYPDGIRPEQYADALAVVRVIDKLFRVATDRDALGESPWRDIAGYGLLGAARAEREP